MDDEIIEETEVFVENGERVIDDTWDELTDGRGEPDDVQ